LIGPSGRFLADFMLFSAYKSTIKVTNIVFLAILYR
jgi:hypothetical protein